ncbi:MAG: mandelate racemase/muconate lactonizing enzyme family protein [Lachnospiraceae bacterium]|nr:mandelate racemase/muconate lactonizing enzyme family protein [Lachnospiraceae bacterium]
MKITSIEVIRLNSGHGPVKGNSWFPTVVRVNTDEGISGIGEIGLAYSSAKYGGFGVCRDYGELLIGQNPMENELIWDKLYRETFWALGGGGFAFGGMSAIDIALWDIKGKALGVPVYTLLGGKLNHKLRTYASQLQLDWTVNCRRLTTPEEYAQAALRVKEEGYTALKVNPTMFDQEGKLFGRYTGLLDRKILGMAESRIKAMREAVGDDIDILLELHGMTDIGSAVQICNLLEKYNIFCAEEAITPLSAANLLTLSQKTTIPQATGERIYGRWGFRPYFENQSVRLAQPDLGNCGGITEGKKIADMAKTYDVGIQAHICGGPVATAAALQFEAAIPNFVIHEQHAVTRMPENIALCKYDYQPVNGYYEIPELPGIGQELSEEALKVADIVTIK